MTARCPRDPTHDRFIAPVDVVQDWVVSPTGELIRALKNSIENTHKSLRRDPWVCAVCGERATFARE